MKTTVNAHRCNPRPRRRIRILGWLLFLPLILLASCKEETDREPPVAVGDIAISNENPFLNLLIQPIPEKESYAENLEALRVRVEAIEAEVFKGVVEAAKSADPVGELSQARADLGEAVKLLQSKDGHEPGRCAAKLRESIGARRKELESKVVATGQTVKDRHMNKLNGIEVAMEKLDGIDKDLSALSSLTESLEGELKEIMELYVDTKSFDGETAAKTELLEILTEKEKEWFPDREEAPATPLRAATKEVPFVNSLGLEFVPVLGKDGVWMARTETRVRDFEKFVEATTYDATEGAFTLESGGWKQAGGSWKDPRFSTSTAQTPDHPVVCVSWEDARAFCAWLGAEEGLRYRLPTDAEWSLAAGQGKYPCGNQFPPPRDGGNYAGAEANTGTFKASNYTVIANFNDGSARTSRVGQYAENRFGFFDLGGNVWEWCEDPYRASMNDADALEAYPFLKEDKDSDGTPFRVLRGGSWSLNAEVYLRSSFRDRDHPTLRSDNLGFRLVVSVGVSG